MTGTITGIRSPGRFKSPGEFHIRFDSLLLLNGVSRDLCGRLLTADGNTPARVDATEGKVKGQGKHVGDAAIQGAIGGAAWGGMRSANMQRAAIGSAIFGGGALVGGLRSRGPEATLQEGIKIIMVLGRPLSFEERDLEGTSAAPAGGVPDQTPSRAEPRTSRQSPYGFPVPFPPRCPVAGCILDLAGLGAPAQAPEAREGCPAACWNTWRRGGLPVSPPFQPVRLSRYLGGACSIGEVE